MPENDSGGEGSSEFTPTTHVEQRAARVAVIDCGIDLDVVVIRRILHIAIEPGDDAGGHRLADLERVADREHFVADLQFRAVTSLDWRQRIVYVHLLDGQAGGMQHLAG